MTEQRGHSNGERVASFEDTSPSGRSWARGFGSARARVSPSRFWRRPVTAGRGCRAPVCGPCRGVLPAAGQSPSVSGSGQRCGCPASLPGVAASPTPGAPGVPRIPAHLCFPGGAHGQAGRCPAPPALTDPPGVSLPKPPRPVYWRGQHQALSEGPGCPPSRKARPLVRSLPRGPAEGVESTPTGPHLWVPLRAPLQEELQGPWGPRPPAQALRACGAWPELGFCAAVPSLVLSGTPVGVPRTRSQ